MSEVRGLLGPRAGLQRSFETVDSKSADFERRQKFYREVLWRQQEYEMSCLKEGILSCFERMY